MLLLLLCCTISPLTTCFALRPLRCLTKPDAAGRAPQSNITDANQLPVKARCLPPPLHFPLSPVPMTLQSTLLPLLASASGLVPAAVRNATGRKRLGGAAGTGTIGGLRAHGGYEQQPQRPAADVRGARRAPRAAAIPWPRVEQRARAAPFANKTPSGSGGAPFGSFQMRTRAAAPLRCAGGRAQIAAPPPPPPPGHLPRKYRTAISRLWRRRAEQPPLAAT